MFFDIAGLRFYIWGNALKGDDPNKDIKQFYINEGNDPKLRISIQEIGYAPWYAPWNHVRNMVIRVHTNYWKVGVELVQLKIFDTIAYL